MEDVVPIIDLAEQLPGKGKILREGFQSRWTEAETTWSGQWLWNRSGHWTMAYREMGQMNLSPFQTWNSSQGVNLLGWHIRRHREQGYASWRKQNQQHGDQASSPACSAGSKCLNPWLDAESSRKVPGAFLTCWSTGKGTSCPNKKAIPAGGLQHLAVTASCPTCSGSLLLAEE